MAAARLRVITVTPSYPPTRAWSMSNKPPLVADLGDAYPECVPDLSPEIMAGLPQRGGALQPRAGGLRSRAYRRQLNGAMADLFDEADFVFCSTHPDVAFKAEGPPPSTMPGRATSSTRSGSSGPS